MADDYRRLSDELMKSIATKEVEMSSQNINLSEIEETQASPNSSILGADKYAASGTSNSSQTILSDPANGKREPNSIHLSQYARDTLIDSLEKERSYWDGNVELEESISESLRASEMIDREEAIKGLLKICAEQNVVIPSQIRKALAITEQSPSSSSQKLDNFSVQSSILLSHCQKTLDQASIDELPITKEFFSVLAPLAKTRKHYDFRIQKGCYKVTVPVLTHEGGDAGAAVLMKKGDDVEAQQRQGPQKKPKIPNMVYGGVITKVIKRVRDCQRAGKCVGPAMETKVIMDNINLRLKSGKMYLILGAPGCGKSTLLKMIASTLRQDKSHKLSGNISLNNHSYDSRDICWTNAVAYIDQIDRLHALLTVNETCDFAWKCRKRGTHASLGILDTPEAKMAVKGLDAQNWYVNMVLKGMGIARVADTFVGDDSKVRGVSGGERKRVTVSEMLCVLAPVVCLDEMSTGLDAATTYDIVRIFRETGGISHRINIVSLLQPPPETVALFDELILLDRGCIIYTGPVEGVVDYFCRLGYSIPDRMDTADWLQQLPTPDGAQFVKGDNGRHLTHDEFVKAFEESEQGQYAKAQSEAPMDEDEFAPLDEDERFINRFANPWYKSIWLVFQREFLLWRRDKVQMRARIIQNLVMGIIVGTVFWQAAANKNSFATVTSTIGVLFQSLFFIFLGAMIKVPPQIESRGVFYKQQDANFFPTWTFVAGRSFALFPSCVIDALIYGTIVYWCVGLAHKNGAQNFFVFLLILVICAWSGGLTMSIFSSFARNRPAGQAMMALTVGLFAVFSGFTVQPNVIPVYWIWLYYINIFAWTMRSLVVNEFQSADWSQLIPNPCTMPENVTIIVPHNGTEIPITVTLPLNETDVLAYKDQYPFLAETITDYVLKQFRYLFQTKGDVVLKSIGFYTSKCEPYTYDWVWWGVLFNIGFAIFAAIVSVIFLNRVRWDLGKSNTNSDTDVEDVTSLDADGNEIDAIDLPFQKVHLTFQNMHYYVKASTSNEQIELLKGLSGYIEAGKMTALMGSSGAGKTTLMDVLSLRKTSGKVEGEVLLNGHPQEPNSFRRCTGYVEQFDTQTPQLTIRETVEFSAQLRLDLSHEKDSELTIMRFVNQTLAMLELIPIQHLLVGSDDTGGLSFEQKKRLSIAVELVANPSIIFLDEPTSGLDARAASIVMQGLKRIALTGRSVCATIHQPSQAIFYDFDTLLLLKRGGETVFFGDLGKESCHLINYFEGYSETQPILPQENPATWMLTTIGSGTSNSGEKNDFDYARAYETSKLAERCQRQIEEFKKNKSEETKVAYLTKYARGPLDQNRFVLKRLMTIYWRSVSYNKTRLIMATLLSLLFGSIFAYQRVPQNESDMNSRITSIYISALFLGVYSFNTTLPVFEVIRNMFYRHKHSRMYRQMPLITAVTLVEIPFILLASMLFNVFFYFLVGFSLDAGKFFYYYLFFTLNMALWTFLGQAFMSVFPDAATAQGFGSVLNGLSSLFAGVLIRPQDIPVFWVFMYWILPTHYVLEGLLVSQFYGDTTPILPASQITTDGQGINGTATCPDVTDLDNCVGTAWQFIEISFGGWFAWGNLPYNLLYLVSMCVLAKIVSLYALTKLNYLNK